MPLGLKGSVTITVRNSDGSIASQCTKDNLVVNGGIDFVFDQIAGTGTSDNMSYIAIGTDNTTPTATDSTLANEIGTRQTLSYSHTAGTSTMTCTATFNAGNGTGTIEELALFTASSGGTMFNRVAGLATAKSSTQSLDITYTLTISSS